MEEFFDVAFQNIGGFSVILAGLAQSAKKIFDRKVRAFVIPGRIRMINETGIKYFIKLFKNHVMDQSIFYGRFMNYSVFRVVNMEFLVSAVFISLVCQFSVKGENIIF